MEALLYDIRHALRHLRQRPLFVAIAALSIAIGIGANTAILSVATTLFLTPPAGLDDAARVVEVGRTMGGRGRDTFSYPELLDMRAQAGAAFEELAGWRLASLSYSTGGDGERVVGMAASHSYFDVMGVRPLRGRWITADEDRVPMANPVAVISERFWRARLDADPGVVGRTINVNRQTFTVVGVAPSAFRGHIIGVQPDIYIPMMMMGVIQRDFHAFDERRASWLMVVGRLKPGVAVTQANAALAALFAHLPQSNDDPRNARGAVADLIAGVPAAGRAPAQAFVGLLLGLVGIILLVTCANVAGMLLARAAARSREIAIRLALGSSRGRLVRQLLVEALVLFGIGGALGLAIATWATGLLSRISLPAPIPVTLDLSPNVAVLAAGMGLALLTGVVFGLAPALQSTRPDLADAMKATGFETGRGGRLRRAFVMGQVGLSLVLLIAAGLFLRSLQRAAAVPTGFDGTGVRVASFDLSIDGYDETRGIAFLDATLLALRAEPGITGAAVTTDLPLDLGISENPMYVAGSPAATEDGAVSSAFDVVSAGYFETLHIGLRAGRFFDARDVAGAQGVAVVSRTFADRVWPGQDAVGKVVRRGDANGPEATIIGVAEDVKNQMLMEVTKPEIYFPVTQAYDPALTLMVRGDERTDAAATLRRVLHASDAALSFSSIDALDHVTSFGILPQRLAAGITSGLGVLALLLSALGVYGVVAFTVAQRTREIGIRMALGAHAPDVVRLVLRGGLRLALPGLIFGLVAGLGLSALLRSFVFGVGPGDPATFLGIPALLVVTVIAACWAPARRAAAVEPTAALRND